MDIKISGVNREILEKALAQAHEGRMFILGKMLEAIDKPNEKLSPYAPQMIKMKIDPEKIRELSDPVERLFIRLLMKPDVKLIMKMMVPYLSLQIIRKQVKS